MFQVAVYSGQQHEQYQSSAERFALSEKAGSCWGPAMQPADDPAQQLAAGNLCFQVSSGELLLEAVPPGCQLPDGRPVDLGDVLPLPCLLRLGKTWLEVAADNEPRPLVPLKQTNLDQLLVTQAGGPSHSGPSTATVTKWLTAVGQLHRAAAGSAEFYAGAARLAVETVGLDAAWVLRHAPDQPEIPWQIVGSSLPQPQLGICFDPAALDTIAASQGTWYQPADAQQAGQNDQAVVIAPVFDADGQLVAALYGARNTHGKNRRQGIRPLEARLIQLLAESVAVGMARHEQETEAARTRVLLEQAFSPTVAQYIQQHPDCLSGQQREVTLLFADLRGYTTLAESMQLTDCYDLLGEVMEALTQVVTRQHGIVVDYYGDGLLALWNAPLEQLHHADWACSAALEMFPALAPIAKKWQHRLSGPLELGIGIHSGPAYVGNAGTHSRLKYGPRGNTVNVASRVQSASKQLDLPLVLTAATQRKLSGKFYTLRVCTAKLPDLERPTELFTAYLASDSAPIQSRLEQYSRALDLFEAGKLEAAEKLLEELTVQESITPAHFLARYTAAQKSSNLGRRAIDKYAASHNAVIEILSK